MALGAYNPDFGQDVKKTEAVRQPSGSGSRYSGFSGDADSGVYSEAMGREVGAAQGQAAPVNSPRPQSEAPAFVYNMNGVNPAADLEYNAALRGYGLSSSSAQARAAYDRGSLNSQLESAIPAFGQQLKEGQTDAGESSAARGAARGSSRLLAEDKVQRDVATREAAFRAGIADKQAQVTFGLQETMNQLEQQRAEAELSARYRMAEEANKEAAFQRAIRDLGL